MTTMNLAVIPHIQIADTSLATRITAGVMDIVGKSQLTAPYARSVANFLGQRGTSFRTSFIQALHQGRYRGSALRDNDLIQAFHHTYVHPSWLPKNMRNQEIEVAYQYFDTSSLNRWETEAGQHAYLKTIGSQIKRTIDSTSFSQGALASIGFAPFDFFGFHGPHTRWHRELEGLSAEDLALLYRVAPLPPETPEKAWGEYVTQVQHFHSARERTFNPNFYASELLASTMEIGLRYSAGLFPDIEHPESAQMKNVVEWIFINKGFADIRSKSPYTGDTASSFFPPVAHRIEESDPSLARLFHYFGATQLLTAAKARSERLRERVIQDGVFAYRQSGDILRFRQANAFYGTGLNPPT